MGARGGRAGLEDTERAQVHGVLGGLDVPERQVEGSERVGTQGLASQGRRTAATGGSAVNPLPSITVKHGHATHG